MMSFDDGATDGKPDAHTVILSCVESLEEPVSSLRLEANARIFHAEAHPVRIISFGSDQQLPWPIFNIAHRVRGVAEQVQDHLLELNAVTCDKREIIGKLRPQNHSVSLKFAER